MAQGPSGANCFRRELKNDRHPGREGGWGKLRGEHGKNECGLSWLRSRLSSANTFTINGSCLLGTHAGSSLDTANLIDRKLDGSAIRCIARKGRNVLKKWILICLLVGLVFPVSRAAGPNYLFDKFGPVDKAKQGIAFPGVT